MDALPFELNFFLSIPASQLHHNTMQHPSFSICRPLPPWRMRLAGKHGVNSGQAREDAPQPIVCEACEIRLQTAENFGNRIPQGWVLSAKKATQKPNGDENAEVDGGINWRFYGNS